MASRAAASVEKDRFLVYSHVNIAGVECFALTRVKHVGKHDKTKVIKRKKEKDVLGGQNLLVPLLDCKIGDNGSKQYCDAIIYTGADNIVKWDESVVSFYQDSVDTSVDSNDISGGVQRIVKVDGETYVSITFYRKCGKFMVQPGNMKECNIEKWLADFSTIKSTVVAAGLGKAAGSGSADAPSPPPKTTLRRTSRVRPRDSAIQQPEQTKSPTPGGKPKDPVSPQNVQTKSPIPGDEIKDPASPEMPGDSATQQSEQIKSPIPSEKPKDAVSPQTVQTKGPIPSDMTLDSASKKPIDPATHQNVQAQSPTPREKLNDSSTPLPEEVESIPRADNKGCLEKQSRCSPRQNPAMHKDLFTFELRDSDTNSIHSDNGLSDSWIDSSADASEQKKGKKTGKKTKRKQKRTVRTLDDKATAKVVVQSPKGRTSKSAVSDGTVPVSRQENPSTNAVQAPTAQEAKLPIINELLCFIQNRHESLPMPLLAKLCVGHYSTEETRAAKQMLYDNVVIRGRGCFRKGDNKQAEDTKDIIKIFYELDLGSTPVFVARDLANLPSISFDNCDVFKLSKDIELLKTQMCVMQDNQRSLVETIKPSNSGTDSTVSGVDQKKKNLPNGAPLGSLTDSSAVPSSICGWLRTLTPTPEHEATNVDDSASASSDQSSETDDTQGGAIVEDLGPQDEEFPPLQNSFRPVYGRTFFSSDYKQKLLKPSNGNQSKQRAPMKRRSSSPSWQDNPSMKKRRNNLTTSDNTVLFGKRNGRIPETSNKSNEIIIGSGHAQSIGKGARNSLPNRDKVDNPNRQCTGVFITRLKTHVAEKDIQAHIKSHTGYVVRPERLTTRYNSYRSYYIPCDKTVRTAIMDAEMWPSPTLLKPFYSRY